MKIQTENCHPTPSTPPDSQFLDRDLREFSWSIRNQLRDPPGWDYDAYCEKIFEFVRNRRRIPKDFAKQHSPRRHRPTSGACLAKLAEQARQRFIARTIIKQIHAAPKARRYEDLCSAFSKEMRRFEKKVFLESLSEWMSKRPRVRYTKVIPALEVPDRIKLRRVPELAFPAETLRRIFLKLRKSLWLPASLTEAEAQELIRRLNHDYRQREHKQGKKDRQTARFYPQFVKLFCTPQL